MKNVLITTSHRGVFFAQVDEAILTAHKENAIAKPESNPAITDLKNCRMAIYWNTTKGVQELAQDGPNSGSKIASPSDVEILHGVTGIFNVTDKAAELWLK